MDHSYYRDKISAYVDNELSPQEREIVQQHISECQECRNLLAELEKLDRFVQQRSQLAGEEYWEQSAQKIEQRLGFTGETKVTDITPSRWKGLVPKLAAVAASIAVLGFIALYERDISRQVSPPAMKATEAPRVGSKKEVPRLSKEDLYKEALTDDKETDRVIPTEQREAEVALAQKDQVVTPEEQPKILEAKAPPAQTVIESVPERIDVLSPTVELAVAGRGEGGIIAEETISIAEPQAAKEFSGFPKIQIETTASSGDAVSVVISAPVLPDDWLQPVSLERWRHRRDSLQTLYADVMSPHKALAAAKSRKKVSPPPVQQVEELLLHSYYQVARLTQDEKERAEAIGFLKEYAQKAESRYKDLALRYLEELSRGEK